MTISEVAILFIGTPYVWAGNDITQGVDCSGFVCEMLRSVGKLDSSDYSAQMLFNKLNKSLTSEIKKDVILFFGESINTITHIAIAINETQMIEAGGEGRTPTDKGYVRIRPISNRSDLVAAIEL